MRRRESISIKPKIFLYLLAFCILQLVALWLVQTVFLESFYKAIKQREVRQSAAYIVEQLQTGDEALWQSEVLQRGDLYVELWSEEGGSRSVSGNRPQGFFLMLGEAQKREIYEQARQQSGFVQLRDTQPPLTDGMPEAPPGLMPGRDRESILYATIVQSPAEGEQLLLVSAEITPVNATIQTLRIQLVIFSIGILSFATALAWLISRRVARPIQNLNDTAARWGSGEYDVHFEGGGYSEITGLADTLNRAAGELRKTEALQKELVANVGHDLRTPLTLIAGYAEMMRDIPEEISAENMQVIIDETNRLGGLVSELMDFSRLQAGTGNIQPQPFNLTGSCREILGRFQKLSEPEGYRTLFIAAEDVWVNADEARIAQVIYNFLINAMVYTGEEKQVTLRLNKRGGRVSVEVADTGPGIPAADLPHIWQRYYKTGGDHKRASTGSGLGLAIAKSILDQHPEAEYGVRSVRGQGSVFWFSLPVWEGDLV